MIEPISIRGSSERGLVEIKTGSYDKLVNNGGRQKRFVWML